MFGGVNSAHVCTMLPHHNYVAACLFLKFSQLLVLFRLPMLLPDFVLFNLVRAVQAAAESLAAVGPEARCESKEFIAYRTLEESPDQQYVRRAAKRISFSSCKFIISLMFHPRLPPNLDVADHTTPMRQRGCA